MNSLQQKPFIGNWLLCSSSNDIGAKLWDGTYLGTTAITVKVRLIERMLTTKRSQRSGRIGSVGENSESVGTERIGHAAAESKRS
jgi:hypothetical protein